MDAMSQEIRYREFAIARDHARTTGDYHLLYLWHSLNTPIEIAVCPRCLHGLWDSDKGWLCETCGRQYTYEAIEQQTQVCLRDMRRREAWNRTITGRS